MTYRDLKDLPRRTTSHKVLCDKKLNIAKTPKYVGYQKGFASNIFQYFDKETSGGPIKDEIMSNQELG